MSRKIREALEVVRLSAGWQVLSAQAKALIDDALAESNAESRPFETGENDFETWAAYEATRTQGKTVEQILREAYEAGMQDPTVQLPSAPMSEQDPVRQLCAAAHQALSAAGGPVEMLDNLSAAGSGVTLPHTPLAGLPWLPDRLEGQDAAVAAIAYALQPGNDGLNFLRLWNEGEFDDIRREWPDCPKEVFIGADPLFCSEGMTGG